MMFRGWGVFAITVAACGGSSARAPDAGGRDAAAVDAASGCHVDPDCGAHQYCDTPATTCRCVAGYTAGGAGACAWTGVVVNPGFDATGGWTPTGATTIDPSATGSIEPGTARVAPIVTQTITMPRRSRAEPLVVVMAYAKPSGMPNVALRLGTVWRDFETRTAGFVTERRCLGAAEYAPETTTGAGAPLELLADYAPPEGVDGDPGDPRYLLDHLDIVPANPGECPDVGVIANGDAEGTGGWTTTTDYATGVTAAFEAGVGEAGTRGYHIHLDFTPASGQYCQAATVSIPVSIPATGSPAISLHHALTAGTSLALTFASDPVLAGGAHVELGTTGTTVACVPASQRGWSTTLQLRVQATGVTCASAHQVADAILDNLAIVDAPACGNGALANAGFEAAAMFGTDGSIVQDAALAHTGTGVLALPLSTTSPYVDEVTYALEMQPYDPAATAGPAVVFYYRTVSAAATNTTLVVNDVPLAGYTADGTWHRALTCLANVETPTPSFFAVQRPNAVTIAARGVNTGTETHPIVYLDDVALGTDPSCPTH